jgi:hypothetical protein
MVGLVNKKGTLKSILYKPVLGGSLVFLRTVGSGN